MHTRAQVHEPYGGRSQGFGVDLGWRRYARRVLTVRTVPIDDADARRLWAEEWSELEGRYGPLRGPFDLPADGVIASLVGWLGEEAVGTVVVRFAAYDGGAPEAEIKRLYVRPDKRGNGFARVLMGAAEDAAARVGVTRLILETGDKQPEAVALYRAIGYRVIRNFGPWIGERHSICMAKVLPTRVLVISGTIGAGKSAVAAGVSDLLAARGARHGWIDGDCLAQAEPPLPGDRYNQELLFDALEGAAPAYRRRGFGLIVIARVVEDPDDRGRYSSAFRSDAGPAEVTIVRLTAPEDVRVARIEAREAEAAWRAWGLARTVALEAILAEAGADDAVVENDGRDAAATAIAVLDVAGW